jgi:hypothetical protein
VWEHVMMDSNDTLLNNHPNVSTRNNWFWDELTAAWTSYGDLTEDLLKPTDYTWDADQGMGRIYHYDGAYASRVLLRGGNFGITSYTGIFAVKTDWHTGNNGFSVGFRCSR